MITRVQVYSSEEPIGSYVVRNGVVVTEPTNENLEKFLREAHIEEPGTGKVLTRDDGQKCLEALPPNFSGTYFHMTPVIGPSAVERVVASARGAFRR
jgi:hypothetical protein